MTGCIWLKIYWLGLQSRLRIRTNILTVDSEVVEDVTVDRVLELLEVVKALDVLVLEAEEVELLDDDDVVAGLAEVVAGVDVVGLVVLVGSSTVVVGLATQNE